MTALGTAFTTMAGNIMDSIGTVLPIAIPILGAVLTISLSIKVVRKITGR